MNDFGRLGNMLDETNNFLDSELAAIYQEEVEEVTKSSALSQMASGSEVEYKGGSPKIQNVFFAFLEEFRIL